MLLLALVSGCKHCEDYDPGVGLLDCETVQICRVGDEAWYEGPEGERYDCLVSSQECAELLCDHCVMPDRYTWEAMCGAGFASL